MPAKEACPSLPAGCGRDGRRRMAALVNSRAAARLLGSASLRGDAVGRRGASSHADLFWARMRDESGRAEGARVCARRRGAREHRRVIGGSRQAPEYTLHAATTARPTAGRFRSIPRDPHAMEAGAARRRRGRGRAAAPGSLAGLPLSTGGGPKGENVRRRESRPSRRSTVCAA